MTTESLSNDDIKKWREDSMNLFKTISSSSKAHFGAPAKNGECDDMPSPSTESVFMDEVIKQAEIANVASVSFIEQESLPNVPSVIPTETNDHVFSHKITTANTNQSVVDIANPVQRVEEKNSAILNHMKTLASNLPPTDCVVTNRDSNRFKSLMLTPPSSFTSKGVPLSPSNTQNDALTCTQHAGPTENLVDDTVVEKGDKLVFNADPSSGVSANKQLEQIPPEHNIPNITREEMINEHSTQRRDHVRNEHIAPFESFREDEIYEKQMVLLELEQLERQYGVRLSRAYTLSDNIADMQLEVRRHLMQMEEATTVKFMKDALKVGCTGLEMLNSRLGPFLELEGWSNEACSDMDRYNSALSKMYKKYCRRSSMSPEMELAMGLIGSLAMHHFKAKFLGPSRSTSTTHMQSNVPHSRPAATKPPTQYPKGGHSTESVPPKQTHTANNQNSNQIFSTTQLKRPPIIFNKSQQKSVQQSSESIL